MTLHFLLKRMLLLVALISIAIGVSFGQSVKQRIIQDILKEKWRLSVPSTILPGPDSKIKSRSSTEFKFSDFDTPSISEGEPYIAVNPYDSNHIIVGYMQLSFELEFPVYYSLNGGDSWQKSSIQTKDVFEADWPDLQIGGGGDPIFAFDPDGRIYMSWIYLGIQGLQGTIVSYWAWSDNGGVDFELAPGSQRYIENGELNLLTGEIDAGSDGIFDRPWFAVNRRGGEFDGTLYCAGLFIGSDSTNFSGNGTVIRMKKPGVDSFKQRQIQVSETLNSQFANLAIDDIGNVHVSYINLDDKRLMHAFVDPGLENILYRDTVAEIFADSTQEFLVHSRENAAPSLATNRVSSNVFLTWSDFVGDYVSGHYAYSNNYGINWSEAIELKDALGTDVDQVLMPVIAANERDEIVLTWYGLNSEDQGNYYLAHSPDAGENWSEPTIISGDSTDFGSYGTNVFFGDYYKTAYVGNTAYVVWSDGRSGQGAKLYFQKLDPRNPVVSTKGITPINDQIQISAISPSPGRGPFSCQIESEVVMDMTFDLVSINGHVVHSWSQVIYPGKQKIDIYNPPVAGQYILSIRSDQLFFSRNLVKVE